MLCAYVDDSGNSGARLDDPQQPFHYVGALIVPETRWENVKNDLEVIARDAFGGKPPTGFEFHGTELYKGRGPWKGFKVQDRVDIYGRCLALLSDHDLDIVTGRCHKALLQRYKDPFHPHYVAFWLCLERIGEYMANRNELGFIVADDSEPSTRTITKKLLDDYRRAGPPFGKPMDVSKVIDTVHFMSSSESAHIQLCDLALYVIRRRHVMKDDCRGLAELATSRIKEMKTFPY